MVTPMPMSTVFMIHPEISPLCGHCREILRAGGTLALHAIRNWIDLQRYRKTDYQLWCIYCYSAGCIFTGICHRDGTYLGNFQPICTGYPWVLSKKGQTVSVKVIGIQDNKISLSNETDRAVSRFSAAEYSSAAACSQAGTPECMAAKAKAACIGTFLWGYAQPVQAEQRRTHLWHQAEHRTEKPHAQKITSCIRFPAVYDGLHRIYQKEQPPYGKTFRKGVEFFFRVWEIFKRNKINFYTTVAILQPEHTLISGQRNRQQNKQQWQVNAQFNHIFRCSCDNCCTICLLRNKSIVHIQLGLNQQIDHNHIQKPCHNLPAGRG